MKGEILPPLSASVHVKRAGWRVGIWLWLPLILLWLLLLVLVILTLPLLLIASLIFRFSLWRSLKAGNAVIAGLRGTEVNVADRDSDISFRIH
jgi:hypothetical protein